MTDYSGDFDQAYGRLRKHSLVLPEEILACKLIHCADLDERDRQLVLSATSKMALSPICSLKRIFSSLMSSSHASSQSSLLTVKQESTETAFFANNFRGRGNSFRERRPFSSTTTGQGQTKRHQSCGQRRTYQYMCPLRKSFSLGTRLYKQGFQCSNC